MIHKPYGVGLDFGGVIADLPKLKKRIAKEKFGIYVPLKDISHKGCLKRGFTEKTYDLLTGYLYSSENVEPIPGALAYVRKLKENGYNPCIISRQETGGVDIIGNFIKQYDLDIPYIRMFSSSSLKSKSIFCFGIDVFVDDRIDHLEEIYKYRHIENLLLFDAPYNKDQKESEPIKRIHGWPEVYEEIRRIIGK